jgi:phospholipase D1/2
VQLHWQYATISRGATSIRQQLLSDPNISDPDDYISFYGLRTHGVIGGKPVTEIVYVHSKLMIIDDDKVIIGSANINDRSQVGNHDSEIAMVVNDGDKLQSTLAGNNRAVSKFAYTLRTNIFKEIMGISDENCLRDPLSDVFTNYLKSTANNNTKIYKNVFRCYPDDEVQRLENLEEFMGLAKLGDYYKYKNDIRGFIVQFPLHFLHDEDLRIKIFNKEFYIPEESFI